MAQEDFVLSVEDLTVSFDGFKAVDGLNLYVDRNEVRVVIGPNGFRPGKRGRRMRAILTSEHDRAILFDNSTEEGYRLVAVLGASGDQWFKPIPDWAAPLV